MRPGTVTFHNVYVADETKQVVGLPNKSRQEAHDLAIFMRPAKRPYLIKVTWKHSALLVQGGKG